MKNLERQLADQAAEEARVRAEPVVEAAFRAFPGAELTGYSLNPEPQRSATA